LMTSGPMPSPAITAILYVCIVKPSFYKTTHIYIRYEDGKNLVRICIMLKIVEKAPVAAGNIFLRSSLSKAAENITSLRGLSLLQSVKMPLKNV